MSRLRLALAAALAAAGILALLLAHDLRAWHATIDRAQADYAVAPKQPLSLTAPTLLPGGVAGGILGVDRDRDWIDALQKFVTTRDKLLSQDQLGPAAYAMLHASEAVLSRLTQERDTARASQAYTLLAVLTFRSAYPGDSVDPGMIQDALSDLQTAVKVDGRDEVAKEDLELVLRGIAAAHSVTLQAQGTGNHVTKLRKGGNGGPPGRGY